MLYRTCSVDSSESSSDEGSEKEPKEEVEELNKVLKDLVRDNKELEVSSCSVLRLLKGNEYLGCVSLIAAKAARIVSEDPRGKVGLCQPAG